MSGILCLKWNNHSTTFTKCINNIQTKEKFCDATIVCEGKFTPVHRFVLSSCSDYFEEIFNKMQCQHPFLIFKDIEHQEMALLLNYMYQGEINVAQENLPQLIKAAEALKVKGLAVAEDSPTSEESSLKEGISGKESTQKKINSEQKRKRRRETSNANRPTQFENIPLSISNNESQESSFENENKGANDMQIEQNEVFLLQPNIKEEVVEQIETLQENYDKEQLPGCSTLSSHYPANSHEPHITKDEKNFAHFPIEVESISYTDSTEKLSAKDHFTNQISTWSSFESSRTTEDHHDTLSGSYEDIPFVNQDTPEFTPGILEMPPPGSSLQVRTSRISRPRKPAPAKPLKSMRQFSCSYCSFNTQYPAVMKRHVNTKHLGDRPFQCHICSKKFVRKEYLQGHVRIHTGEKPFTCPNCPKKFRIRSTLFRHLERKNQCGFRYPRNT